MQRHEGLTGKLAGKQMRGAQRQEETAAMLRHAGLRPTRPRLALAGLLFRKEHHHLTAETLHDEASRAGVKVSLATVYNTLHQFTGAGLLRQVVVDAQRSYFDTNVGDHQHFFCEDDGTLIDIPGEAIAVAGIPALPKGMAVECVDVVVRLKRA
ncbi:MAG TPA: Fur family transcriptional regulator [Rhizomicrobium sp.]|nr:Fur family transcriptional regulator [Rhizomicrobium sp.]